jgi:hypothetical protein
MGFDSVKHLHPEGPRLQDAIWTGKPLTPRDWRRVLLLTEVVFASDVVGSGVEWATTTGLSDEDTIWVLRAIQRKLVRVR